MSQEVSWVDRLYDKYIRRKNLRTFFKLLECETRDRDRRGPGHPPAADLLLGIFMTQTRDQDHINGLRPPSN